MDVTLRLARKDDLPAILDLLADDDLGIHPERGGHGDIAPYADAFDEIAADPHSRIYVATLGDRVAGTFRLMFHRHLTHRGGGVATIETVIVASDVRRPGATGGDGT
jgi:hypothetical protein